jgi:ribonuclease HII
MDSKAFKSRSKRTSATEILRTYGLFEIARADPAKIDRLNIRGATLAAMSEAALRLSERMRLVTEVLFDGKDLPAGFGLPGRAIIKGDAGVMEISAASMIAKTLRDAEMDLEAVRYPGYGFEKHAGYGTLAHRDAIRRLGLCPIHRSWAEKFSDQSTK